MTLDTWKGWKGTTLQNAEQALVRFRPIPRASRGQGRHWPFDEESQMDARSALQETVALTLPLQTAVA